VLDGRSVWDRADERIERGIHCCPFFFFTSIIMPDQRPYIVKNMCVCVCLYIYIYICTHISGCLEISYVCI
jgi:hypothetical protein